MISIGSEHFICLQMNIFSRKKIVSLEAKFSIALKMNLFIREWM
jgi:hypothetical protein